LLIGKVMKGLMTEYGVHRCIRKIDACRVARTYLRWTGASARETHASGNEIGIDINAEYRCWRKGSFKMGNCETLTTADIKHSAEPW
jgi:hypothetical protein